MLTRDLRARRPAYHLPLLRPRCLSSTSTPNSSAAATQQGLVQIYPEAWHRTTSIMSAACLPLAACHHSRPLEAAFRPHHRELDFSTRMTLYRLDVARKHHLNTLRHRSDQTRARQAQDRTVEHLRLRRHLRGRTVRFVAATMGSDNVRTIVKQSKLRNRLRRISTLSPRSNRLCKTISVRTVSHAPVRQLRKTEVLQIWKHVWKICD